MQKNYKQQKATRTFQIHALVSKIRSKDKRNQLRGFVSKPEIYSEDVKAIRLDCAAQDIGIIGALLKGPGGLLDRGDTGLVSADLFHLSSFPALDWKNEIGYTAGYVNAWAEPTLDILHSIKDLSRIESMPSEVVLQLLLEMSQRYGASNYLSYKLAYIRTARELSAESAQVVSAIEKQIEHRNQPGLHFSALENISPKISLFMVAQRRVSGLVGHVDGDFRKALSLSNFIPTPIDLDDVAGYFLRATESSLVDTIYAILTLFNLNDDFGLAVRELEVRLNIDIQKKIGEVLEYAESNVNEDILTEYYLEQNAGGDYSANLYRVSSAFLEKKNYTIYRNKIDRVIGARLLEEVAVGKAYSFAPLADKEALLAPVTSSVIEVLAVPLDTFYRTFLFLRFVQDRTNLLGLSSDDIKFVLENTLGLDTLLSDKEIRAIFATSPKNSKSLIAVLAMALFRSKSIDPDIDFEFRTDFIDYVIKHHDGSIVKFIEELLYDSPQVANYIVSSLDEVTLEKLYTLVENASAASSIRIDILRAVGQRLNRIEFFIEADAIKTRESVSKLQKYFDSSRMYVDSIAMKKWLDSNPTISAEQLKSLFPKIETHTGVLEHEHGNIFYIAWTDNNQYLVSQIAKDAFEQFCLNNEFGIQSYLGRRIRHNTLDGVTTDTVDAVFRKSEYGLVLSNPNIRRTVQSWIAVYRAIVDKLRRERLQFKSSGSFFNSVLDLEDSVTKENIRNLTNQLRSAGGTELSNDLVIAFCWKQITPQLEHAARYIKTTLLNEANMSIDKFFSGYHGAVEAQIKADLHVAVNEVFKKIADWFQVPQTGFISSSVEDLCRIILLDLKRENHVEFSGNALTNKYTGISVHRLYDCIDVLLKNAHKHGQTDEKIFITVDAFRNPNAVFNEIEFRVTSSVAAVKYNHCRNRIIDAINAPESSTDMVTEGYTGIKKIKFITRSSEGTSTLKMECDDDNRSLTLGFSMKAEIAAEEVADEVAE